MDTYIKTFTQWIKQHSLISCNDSILLSLSAGKDSLFMLDLMAEIREQYNLRLGIFHLNHCMRGDESEEDVVFLQNTAHAYGLPIYEYTCDFTSHKQGMSFEQTAREKRYELLKACCDENNYRLIATAHNRDDSIETILMRVFSGTGLKGLCGIPPLNRHIIRPVLCFSSEEIYHYLNTQNIQWREDSSNQTSAYDRNFLRNELMPLIESRFPSAKTAVENLSVIAADSLSLLNEYVITDSTVSTNDDSMTIHTMQFASDKHLMHGLSVLIPEFFQENPGMRMIHEIVRRMKTTRKNHVMYHMQSGTISWDNQTKNILFKKGNSEKKEVGKYEYFLHMAVQEKTMAAIPEINGSVMLFPVKYDTFLKLKGNKDYIFVTIRSELQSIILRNKRDGDRIKFQYGTKKIKDLLTEKKLDNEMKNCVPFLVVNNRIAAIMPGFIYENIPNRISDEFQVTSPDDCIIAVKYEKKFPEIVE